MKSDSNCDRELIEGELSCATCDDEITQHCPACGEQLPVKANFCPKCGNVINTCDDAKEINRQLNDTDTQQQTLTKEESSCKTSANKKQETSAKEEHFFLKYWRGNYSLGESVCIYILINILANGIFTVSLKLLANGFQQDIYLPSITIVPFLIITLYQIVGSWRSANKYQGKMIWRYLVYAFIVVSIVGSVPF